MARQIVFLDDLDGSPDAESVTFAVRGVAYEIDLGPANRERFDKSLAEFIEHARKGEAPVVETGARQSRRTVATGTQRKATPDREHAQAVRDWARGQGMEVAERGRIPSQVLGAYNEAHQARPAAPREQAAPTPTARELAQQADEILKQQPKDKAPRPDLPTAEEMAALHEESKAFAPARPAKAAPPALFSAPEQTAAPESEPTDDQAQVMEVTSATIVAWMESKGMPVAGLKFPARLSAFKKGHPGVEVRYIKASA